MNKSNTTTDYRDDLKKKILTCAMNNFRQKGVKSVKMDDIASQLSISKRTLYELYKNKEELLLACIKDHHDMMDDKILAQLSPNSNVIDILIAFLKINIEESSCINPVFYSEIHKYPKVLGFLYEKQNKRRTRSVGFMKRGVEEGFFREDVNYEIINQMVDIFMKHVMATQLYNRFPLPAIIHNVIIILLRGICTEKGLDELAKRMASIAKS